MNLLPVLPSLWLCDSQSFSTLIIWSKTNVTQLLSDVFPVLISAQFEVNCIHIHLVNRVCTIYLNTMLSPKKV